MNQKINIGLFGYGVVGESLHHVLTHSKTVDAQIIEFIKDQIGFTKTGCLYGLY